MQLSKHHGLGNDFLVVLDEHNGRALDVDGALARRLCDRHRGIGADGLLHGFAPPECARIGNLIAATTLRGTGDWETTPYLAEVEHLLRPAVNEAR